MSYNVINICNFIIMRLIWELALFMCNYATTTSIDKVIILFVYVSFFLERFFKYFITEYTVCVYAKTPTSILK